LNQQNLRQAQLLVDKVSSIQNQGEEISIIWQVRDFSYQLVMQKNIEYGDIRHQKSSSSSISSGGYIGFCMPFGPDCFSTVIAGTKARDTSIVQDQALEQVQLMLTPAGQLPSLYLRDMPLGNACFEAKLSLAPPFLQTPLS
jgi:hypothetical protein